MKAITRLLATAALALGALASAQAATLLGTISKDYGRGAGKVSAPSLGSGSCDTLGGNAITVRDTSPSLCGRFHDSFDFSGLDFASIDHFELTLSYSGTEGSVRIPFLGNVASEFWRIRPAAGGSYGTEVDAAWQYLTRSNGLTSTDFLSLDAAALGTISALGGKSLFQEIVDRKEFSLWFAEEGLLSNSFSLFSAELRIYGTQAAAQVPAPGVLSLVGVGLLAAWARRRKA